MTPKNSPEKVYVGPCLCSFRGSEAHKLFSGGLKWGVSAGGQKFMLKKFMCFFPSPITFKSLLCFSVLGGRPLHNLFAPPFNAGAPPHLSTGCQAIEPVGEGLHMLGSVDACERVRHWHAMAQSRQISETSVFQGSHNVIPRRWRLRKSKIPENRQKSGLFRASPFAHLE